jgi:beta-fructofuranosidase
VSICFTAHKALSLIDVSLTIDEWPMANLTGFRDPYAFTSPLLSSLLANNTNATGDLFLTISGGVHTSVDPSGGPRLFLYRQTIPHDVRQWTYLGPLVSVPALGSLSEWSGNFGINFETACVVRLDARGDATYNLEKDAIDFIGFGTEEGRNGSHENHWPLCEYSIFIAFFFRCKPSKWLI